MSNVRIFHTSKSSLYLQSRHPGKVLGNGGRLGGLGSVRQLAGRALGGLGSGRQLAGRSLGGQVGHQRNQMAQRQQRPGGPLYREEKSYDFLKDYLKKY